MAKYLRGDRVVEAVKRLADWRGKVQSQTSSHIFPYLALIRKGVSSQEFGRYEEADDFEFFDTFFRVGANAEFPYFDPLLRKRRIASHPHSNISTARKGTFEKSWGAGQSKLEDGVTLWKLASNAPEIMSKRVMTRGGVSTRVNALDIAVWLYRSSEFEDAATGETLRDKFRAEFAFSDAEFNALFEYQQEPADRLFLTPGSARPDYDRLLERLVISDEPPVARSPSVRFEVKLAKSELDDEDPIVREVRYLLAIGTSGIVLRGAPGTGKSWYAWNIALALTKNDVSKIYRVQFHPSYGYEDFFEGYVADESTKSGFRIQDKVFLRAVDSAKTTEGLVILVIDEINRGDTARVFGEVLTYMEQGWRDVPFTARLSGKTIQVPPNLLLIGTMNPHDRSITQLDMALLRRFDHIEVAPIRELASEFLREAGMPADHVDAILPWFDNLQKLLPFGIGHTYFRDVGDLAALGLVWRYRILPFCESLLEFEPDQLNNIRASFEALERRLRGQNAAGD